MCYSSLEHFIQVISDTCGSARLYIVGAGFRGNFIGKYLQRQNIPFEAYIDYDTSRETLNGKQILSYADIRPGYNAYYLLSSDVYTESMAVRLRAAGISSDHIILPLDRILFDVLYRNFAPMDIVRRISIFHNMYRGERCFVIGNGPSLRVDDLDKLRKEKCFACNGIYSLYDYTSWRPDFFCAGDPSFIRLFLGDSKTRGSVLKNCAAMFVSTVALSEPWTHEEKNNEKIFYYITEGMKDDNSFSSDCSKTTYASMTISFTMIQLAAYMGFSEIYLLGIDFTFSEVKNEHGEVQTIQKDHALIERKDADKSQESRNMIGAISSQKQFQLRGYKAAKKYADAHGIKIYNATRGGKLEVFPRVDFDDLMQNLRGGYNSIA